MNGKKDISLTETAKMIRGALKQAFPNTKFSVRSKSYSMGCSIDARWTDGPTQAQVKPILDRFEGSGFDGMTDCSYYCGERVFAGQLVDFHSGYVRGDRSESLQLLRKVADRVAYECGVAVPEVGQYGVLDRDTLVPFAWHSHWHRDAAGNEIPLTVDDIEGPETILAHNSHQDEYLSRLIYSVAHNFSLEEQKPVELPEYIDKDETVSTGRASFEEPMKKFGGHTITEVIQ